MAANNARPQRFAIRGEYAVVCEGLGSNNVLQASPGDLTDGPSASGVRTRSATLVMSHSDATLPTLKRLLADRDCAGSAALETVNAVEEELGVRLPNSFRLFLHHFGAGCLSAPYEVFGVPSTRATDAAPPRWVHILDVDAQLRRHDDHQPASFVAFSSDGCGITLFLDTARMDQFGECPVVARGPGVDDVVVAPSFLAFVDAAVSGDPLAGI